MHSSIRAVLLLMACCLAVSTLAAERIAVFDAELYDTSGEGPRADQQHRLQLISEELRQALAASGRYELVDTSPLRARLQAGPALRSCATCASAAAAELGAGAAMLTMVHKVSNLILSITVVELDADPQAAVRRAMYSTEIRGNTDESWLRGLRWLLRNRLLAPPSR